MEKRNKEPTNQFEKLREEIDDILNEYKDKQEGMLNVTFSLSQKIQMMANILEIPFLVDSYGYDSTRKQQNIYQEQYGYMFQTFFRQMLRLHNKIEDKLDEMQEIYNVFDDEYKDLKRVVRGYEDTEGNVQSAD